MHGKLKGLYSYIFTEETYRLSKLSYFTSMKTVKNMDSLNNWRRSCCFAFIMQEVSSHAKDSESSENYLDQVQHHFACSYLSTIFDRKLEADLWLSCLSQMSMIAIFVPSMKKVNLASVCSVSVDDVSNCVS